MFLSKPMPWHKFGTSLKWPNKVSIWWWLFLHWFKICLVSVITLIFVCSVDFGVFRSLTDIFVPSQSWFFSLLGNYFLIEAIFQKSLRIAGNRKLNKFLQKKLSRTIPFPNYSMRRFLAIENGKSKFSLNDNFFHNSKIIFQVWFNQ